MARQVVPTINEVFRQIFMAVGPARFGAYALATTSAGGEDDLAEERVARATMRIVEAEEMLTEGGAKLLAEIGLAFAADVEPLRVEALDAVRRLRVAAESARRGEAGAGFASAAALADAAERAITAFLDAFEAQSVQEGQKQSRRDSDAIRTAVAEIRTISASINLISINAAIEAARAGEAGHGFSVIATEIRNLSAQSQRSLDAIIASVERV